MDEGATAALQRPAVAFSYALSLAHVLVVKRVTDDPDSDATSISARLGWPVAVIEELLGDLERQGMIGPSRTSR